MYSVSVRSVVLLVRSKTLGSDYTVSIRVVVLLVRSKTLGSGVLGRSVFGQ